ncbi:MAG: methyltransferase, partial [Gammaproteobacteria bacterium]|nr:methyltransferase [Gammaproteobacteria bacterium]
MYQQLTDIASDFFAEVQNDARRVFHGRGQCYPGLEHLTVDWYPPVLLITAYDIIDDPESLKSAILSQDRLAQIECVLIQHRKRKGTPSICLHGETINRCIVTEGGLKFEVQPGVNQNAGLFLDMAPLRTWLQENSENRNILNLFAYTCSLSVAALAGGATQAVNVDMSKPSISWGIRNHELNGQ